MICTSIIIYHFSPFNPFFYLKKLICNFSFDFNSFYLKHNQRIFLLKHNQRIFLLFFLWICFTTPTKFVIYIFICHILQKIDHFLKIIVLSCHFFHIFNSTPPAAKPIFSQKNVNSVKTIRHLGSKKSIGCPSFPIFHCKIICFMLILCQKNVHSLKNIMFPWAYFIKKTSILTKNALISFFQILQEKILAFMPILGRKIENSVKTTLYYGPNSQ